MLLEVENLKKSYAGPDGEVPVLDGIGFSLDAGETLALTGESGSGKSTLLHLVGGLDIVESGSIRLDGAEIARLDDSGRAALRRSEIGIVFQQFNLIPSLDIAANISFHARLAGREDKRRTAYLIDALGLGDHTWKYPDQLSGGQQQRVAIARTLAAGPRLLLADEPTGNLDETTSAEVLDQMLRLVAETNAALLMVTHSTRLAQRMERHLHLSRGRLT